MMRGLCKLCTWEFDLVALPMPITEAAAVCQQAHCPMCGATSSSIAVCESRPLTPAEQQHKAALLARRRPEPAEA